MKHPKFKNALLCRILIYIAVIGTFLIPTITIACLPFIPEILRLIVVFLGMFGLLFFIAKNIIFLFASDLFLGLAHCKNMGRTKLPLNNSFSSEKAKKKISRFGKGFAPVSATVIPEMLRYKSSPSPTIDAKSIEKVIAVYNCDFLDSETYSAIFSAAKKESEKLTGRIKPKILDNQQKKSSLNRVTVIFIFASHIDMRLRPVLHETLCRGAGDGIEISYIPCVIDLYGKECFFDCQKIPYSVRFAIKNTGIRLIRKYIFNGHLPIRKSQDRVAPLEDYNPEQSLWDFLVTMRKEMGLADKTNRKLFEKMSDGEIRYDDECIYIKYQKKGVWQALNFHEDTKTVDIENLSEWIYPNTYKIGKETIKILETMISEFFNKKGYTVNFMSLEKLIES